MYHFLEKNISSMSCVVNVDCGELSHNDMYSNRYTSSKVPSKLNPKSITSHFDKEQLGYWFDPNAENFLSNFSTIKISKKAETKEVATNIIM